MGSGSPLGRLRLYWRAGCIYLPLRGRWLVIHWWTKTRR